MKLSYFEVGFEVLAESLLFDPESVLGEELVELPEEPDPVSELPDEPDDELASELELELEPESDEDDDELDAFSDSLAFERDFDRDESLLSVL